jgi:hypothetical protein
MLRADVEKGAEWFRFVAECVRRNIGLQKNSAEAPPRC